MWMKDTNGNWFCDAPLCSGCCTPSLVWDKNKNGAWFLSEPGAISAAISSFPVKHQLSLAV